MNNHIAVQIFMYTAAAFAVLGALGAAFSKNPIRGAMSLLVLVLSIAVMFLSLHAEFLAFIQLIVYAGAIVTAISISVDKAVPAGVTVDADCKASLLAQPPERKP